jgi:hypothetical protein
VLRLDLLLLAAHQLAALAGVSHLCEEEDVMEVRGVLLCTAVQYGVSQFDRKRYSPVGYCTILYHALYLRE